MTSPIKPPHRKTRPTRAEKREQVKKAAFIFARMTRDADEIAKTLEVHPRTIYRMTKLRDFHDELDALGYVGIRNFRTRPARSTPPNRDRAEEFRRSNVSTIQNTIESRLWAMADELRANSRLRASDYSTPVLGLIFLRHADDKFTQVEREDEIRGTETTSRRRRSEASRRAALQARGVFFLPENARFQYLLNLPESEDIARAINDAMRAIEEVNSGLDGILPKTYNQLERSVLFDLLRTMAQIPMDIEGDVFGKIYEYFLGNFAMAEGARGGEFFTPTSLVKLIVEILQPFEGRILDPACGSGGMFVQSAEFIHNHRQNGNGQISIYGTERVAETIRLCKMNLAVHGLEGDIRQANSYYEDPHRCLDKFDFVMANPPFNVDRVDRERLRDDPRFPFGMPRVDNANYLWIQLFYSALNSSGRAGFVMGNSAADARASELEIRRQIIETRVVDVMVSVSSNFFYTVTLPCTLWFFDKSKRESDRVDQVLFIDARHIYQQIDRAHREFTPQQIEFLSNIARLYRGETPENQHDSAEMTAAGFPDAIYVDVPGLCKVATVEDIEEQGWSLNPGRYVGVAEREADAFEFSERFGELNEELETLNVEAHQLERQIAENAAMILEDTV